MCSLVPAPGTVDDLQLEAITRKNLVELAESMPRRTNAVIQDQGSYSRY